MLIFPFGDGGKHIFSRRKYARAKLRSAVSLSERKIYGKSIQANEITLLLTLDIVNFGWSYRVAETNIFSTSQAFEELHNIVILLGNVHLRLDQMK